MIEQKYINLASTIRDIIEGESQYKSVKESVPASLVHMTAAALQSAFENGEETADGDQLYNPEMIENYGGFYDAWLTSKWTEIERRNTERKEVRNLARKLFVELEREGFGTIDILRFHQASVVCFNEEQYPDMETAYSDDEEAEEVKAVIEALRQVVKD